MGQEYGKQNPWVTQLLKFWEQNLHSYSWRYLWLLKCFPDTTKVPIEKHFNKKLLSVRFLTETAMACWRRSMILYKKADTKKKNLKCVFMSYIMLHVLCIYHHDPCNQRWIFSVGNVPFDNTIINRIEIKKEPIAVVKHIAYCLWEHSERQFLAVCKKYIFV